MAYWTQVSDSERIRSSRKRRKSRLKEREHGSPYGVKGAKSNYFRRNQMAQVTYRGVKYDSEEYNAKVLAEASQKQRHELMYRGLKVTKKVAGGV